MKLTSQEKREIYRKLNRRFKWNMYGGGYWTGGISRTSASSPIYTEEEKPK